MTEPRYQLNYWVAYEGESHIMDGTLDEVKAWFKTRDKRRYPLDDLSLYRLDVPDIYALAAEAEGDDTYS